MCTVSWWWRSDHSLSLWFNRDEQHARPVGSPPTNRETDLGRVLCPYDPAGDGTWLLANVSGLVLAIVNDYQTAYVPERRESRGVLPFRFAACFDLDSFRKQAGELSLSAFPGFRLLAFWGGRVCVLSWNGEDATLTSLDGPCGVVATSSVRPEEIVTAREQRFRNAWGSGGGDFQQRFHSFANPKDPAEGPLMDRDDARTVSVTRVTVDDHEARMAYSSRATNGGFTSAPEAVLQLEARDWNGARAAPSTRQSAPGFIQGEAG
ncbi:MAG: NRDE family protein [Opitutales bacterium]